MNELIDPGRPAKASGAAFDLRLQVNEQVLQVGESAGVARSAGADPTNQLRVDLGVMVLVVVVSAVYAKYQIGSGWVPADEGTLGQSALRVMGGQLPHRDFAEIYTGGLSILHAMAFRIFGVNLMAMRICVYLFFVAWVPVVYYIGRRFTPAVPAGVITLVAVVWSFPNYPAAMPSWYNLFFATFGAAAMLRYLDTRKFRWLFAAGVCGGVSILVKVIGAYYVAGALLFLAFLEQSDSQAAASDDRKGGGSISYTVFSGAALTLFMAVVVYVFHGRLGLGEVYHFVLPVAAIVIALLVGERSARGEVISRFQALMKLVGAFVCGVALPLIVFLIPYAKSGGIRQFAAGVMSSAIRRSSGLSILRPAPPEKILFSLLLAALVAGAIYRRELQGKIVSIGIGGSFLLLLIKAPSSGEIVSGTWYSVAMLTPIVVLAGAWLSRDGKVAAKLPKQRVMLLVCLAAMCSYVQYPFAAPIYLCYALPLTLLAAAAVVTTARREGGTYVLSAILGFYLLFGVALLVPDHIYELTHKVGATETLNLERSGGLRIEYARNFAELVDLLKQYSQNGVMYAGNDCPELYFLSGLDNVTSDDSGAAPAEVLRALHSDKLKLVVINESPFFPLARMDPDVRAEVIRNFPESRMAGIFHVYWRK